MKLRNYTSYDSVSVKSTPEAIADLMSKVWKREVKPEQIRIEYYGCDNPHGEDGAYKVFVSDEFVALSDEELEDVQRYFV